MEDYRLLHRLSDRDLIGPGVWFMLHLIAAHDDKNEHLEKAFPEIIDLLKKFFPCEECRVHFNDLNSKIDVDTFANEQYSHFKWSYIAHKTVNERLSKETPSFEGALKYFSNPKSTCPSCSVKKARPKFVSR